MSNEFSNWGRWGKDDELGAINLATPDRVVSATSLVKKGRIYSLSAQIREGRKLPRLDFRPENQHYVRVWGAPTPDVASVAEDTLILGCHGTSTHIDALCHYWSGNEMYNGIPASTVQGFGATKLGIEKVRNIVTRGVLLDVAAMKGVPNLEGGYTITTDDLQACCERQKVAIRAGDVVLFRTGWPKTYRESPERYNASQPGIDWESGLWLCRKDICALGSDNSGISVSKGKAGAEVMGGGVPVEQNIHELFLKRAGIYLIEMMDLEAISRDRVYEFLFMAAPLPVTGGTGSSVNPLAIV